MLNKRAIEKAVKKLDIQKLGELFNSSKQVEEDVDQVIGAIKHTGCLIDRYGLDEQRATHTGQLIRMLMERCTSEQLRQIYEQFKQAQILNLAFKEIKTTIANEQAFDLMGWTRLVEVS